MDETVPAFRVLLTMNVHAGMEIDFERAWYQASRSVSDHPANLGHSLMRSADEDGVYYICSDWRTEEQFRGFEGSDEHLRHRALLHPFRSAGSMRTMRVVGHVRGAAG